MSGPQFPRDNQVRHLLAHRLRPRITEQTLGRDVPFLHATVIANDNDGIEGRIEDRLAVLFTAGELFPLLSSELLRRFYQQVAKKLVNDSLGVGSRRGIEFRYFAGKGVQAINRDYLPDVPQPANDLVE